MLKGRCVIFVSFSIFSKAFLPNFDPRVEPIFNQPAPIRYGASISRLSDFFVSLELKNSSYDGTARYYQIA